MCHSILAIILYNENLRVCFKNIDGKGTGRGGDNSEDGYGIRTSKSGCIISLASVI